MVHNIDSSNKGIIGGAAGREVGLPRPQSSLELLSQTAAVMEHSPPQALTQNNFISFKGSNSDSGSSIISAGTSPKQTRGVTPTDSLSSSMASQLGQRIPSLPDMCYNEQKKQPVVLEQKRNTSFLPTPLPSDLHHSTTGGDAESERSDTPLYYSPGLFLPFSGVNQTQHQIPGVANAPSSESEEAGGVVPNFLTSHCSFNSNGSLASGPSMTFSTTVSGNISVMPAPAAAFVPPQLSSQFKQGSFDSITVSADHEQAIRENLLLRQQVAMKDDTIDSLRKQVSALQNELHDLHQLPSVGKVSQIPVE